MLSDFLKPATQTDTFPIFLSSIKLNTHLSLTTQSTTDKGTYGLHTTLLSTQLYLTLHLTEENSEQFTTQKQFLLLELILLIYFEVGSQSDLEINQVFIVKYFFAINLKESH